MYYKAIKIVIIIKKNNNAKSLLLLEEIFAKQLLPLNVCFLLCLNIYIFFL